MLTKRYIPALISLLILIDSAGLPKDFVHSTLIRLSVIAFGLGLARLQRTLWINRHAYTLPMHIYTLLMSMGITTDGFLSHYSPSAYLWRLNLIATLSFTFFPWRWPGLLASAATLYIPYFIFNYLTPNADPNAHTLFLVSMVSAAAVGYMVNYTVVRDLHRAFEERLALFRKNEHKDSVIDTKTRESVHLERLTTQFSPQVLHAIKSGELAIDKRVRRPITAIFIDIENSSSRSKHLDHVVYEETLAEFFTLVTEILLKHDITIGTYLGDGLVAFANAPNESSDHEARAVGACLDLLTTLTRMKTHFNEKWRADFNVRIGINSGTASIGFFPNEKFGAYTALGESVNLAARLCAAALANTICVPKPVLKTVALILPDLHAEPHGNANQLKGFQTDSLETFLIRSSRPSHSASECPRCASALQTKADLDTCVLLTCPSCGYSDIAEKKLAALKRA